MNAPRTCLDCGKPTRKSRCIPCTLARQRIRNKSPERQALYGGTWQAYSERRRKEQPWCSLCGRRGPLSVDHDTDLVMCVQCNSSRRRNPT